MLPLLPISGSGAALGTRQRTITPVAITNPPVPLIYPSDRPQLRGLWLQLTGSGVPARTKASSSPTCPPATREPPMRPGSCRSSRISDIHITDKESPCQAIYFGYQGSTATGNSSSYSPVMLYTTQVLDAAVRTANALHRLTPFDFAMSLGDDATALSITNSAGLLMSWTASISPPAPGPMPAPTPSIIRNPIQAAGLDPAIPWYAVLGNHDHFWMGGLPVVAITSGHPIPTTWSSCWESEDRRRQ